MKIKYLLNEASTLKLNKTLKIVKLNDDLFELQDLNQRITIDVDELKKVYNWVFKSYTK